MAIMKFARYNSAMAQHLCILVITINYFYSDSVINDGVERAKERWATCLFGFLEVQVDLTSTPVEYFLNE